jgi:hypothetical protein
MADLPRLVSYESIKRGKIFNVATPFTSGRPLDFVVEEKNTPGLYRIVPESDGFEGIYDPVLKRKVAQTVKVITEFKLRLAVVVQNDIYNHDPNYHSVIVIPIASIYPEDEEEPLMQRMMTANDFDLMHYLGEVTGRKAYAQINNPRIIHKNMLFEPPKAVIIQEKTMDLISKKLAVCLQIKRIQECDECSHNCEKCEYKLAVNK